jgi:hypothetical protein
VVLYKDLPSFREKHLSFVGFLSKKREVLSPTISHNIARVDKELVKELEENPWLLSYSSMELTDGNWCNLVVFNQEEAKERLVESATHRYAAYQLAPEYYEWVRLHNGTMSQELGQLVIHTTKSYRFKRGQESPQGDVFREHRYEQTTPKRDPQT